MLYTTHAFSPLVDGGHVIFHVGGNDKGALTAFDLTTGAVRWSWTGDGPGYASPIVATFDGVRQIVTPTQTKIVGVDATTGALLWERPMIHQFVSNSITPIVSGQTIIVAGTGPLFAFALARRAGQWTTEQLWENSELPLRFTTPVVSGDMLFGLSGRNSGQVLRDGREEWKDALDFGRPASRARFGRSRRGFPVQPRERWRTGRRTQQRDGVRAHPKVQGLGKRDLGTAGDLRQSRDRQGRDFVDALVLELSVPGRQARTRL